MYELPRIRDARYNVVSIELPALPEQPQTSLAAAALAAAVSLTVADNTGLTNGDYLILGLVGSNTTEVATVNGAVTSGTALSVAATVFPHPTDTPVRRTLWNQVEISGAATITGSKTVITTTGLQFGSETTDYVVTGTTYAYYFVRYKNSGSGVFSAYSDAAPAAGYSSDTIRQIKNEALNMTGQYIGDIITDDFLNTEIVNCETEMYVLGPGKRWAHFLINNFSLGTLTAGETKFALPTDIADPDTDQAIQEIHTRQVTRLTVVEKSVIDEIRWDVALSTLSNPALAGDTSITLANVGDFMDEGSVLIGSDTVNYTSRDTTLLTLSGIPASGTGSITATHAVGSDVWQGGQTQMTPTIGFVYPGYFELALPPIAPYIGQNLYCSYYSKPVYPNSDADVVNFPDVGVYHNYLAWKIQLRLSNGVPNDSTNTFMAAYESKKLAMMGRARLQDQPTMKPRRAVSRQDIGRAPANDYIYWRII